MYQGPLSHGGVFDSNVARLVSTGGDPLSEEEEPYPEDRDDEEGSEEFWDDKQDDQDSTLRAATLQPGSSTFEELTLPDEPQDGILPRDIQKKTAYYDYVAEKQMSQTDAKLFYQQSQLEGQMTGGSNGGSQYSPQVSPVITSTG